MLVYRFVHPAWCRYLILRFFSEFPTRQYSHDFHFFLASTCFRLLWRPTSFSTTMDTIKVFWRAAFARPYNSLQSNSSLSSEKLPLHLNRHFAHLSTTDFFLLDRFPFSCHVFGTGTSTAMSNIPLPCLKVWFTFSAPINSHSAIWRSIREVSFIDFEQTFLEHKPDMSGHIMFVLQLHERPEHNYCMSSHVIFVL